MIAIAIYIFLFLTLPEPLNIFIENLLSSLCNFELIWMAHWFISAVSCHFHSLETIVECVCGSFVKIWFNELLIPILYYCYYSVNKQLNPFWCRYCLIWKRYCFHIIDFISFFIRHTHNLFDRIQISQLIYHLSLWQKHIHNNLIYVQFDELLLCYMSIWRGQIT